MFTELPQDYRPRQRLGVKYHQRYHEEYLFTDPNGRRIGTNEVGLYIWQMCNGNLTIREITEEVTKRYNVGLETARRDTDEFIQGLMGSGLIEREPLLKEQYKRF